jgi:hypothetical protein
MVINDIQCENKDKKEGDSAYAVYVCAHMCVCMYTYMSVYMCMCVCVCENENECESVCIRVCAYRHGEMTALGSDDLLIQSKERS